MWEMDQPWEGFDNVILASPVLKTRRMSDNGTTIEFIYTNFPDADAESALNCSYDALKFFRRLYKIAGEENTYIKFSLSASGTSGGYSRKTSLRSIPGLSTNIYSEIPPMKSAISGGTKPLSSPGMTG